MRLSKYLIENSSQFREFDDYIKKIPKEWLDKKFYSGRYGNKKEEIKVKKIRKNRKPRDSAKPFHEFMDNLLFEKYKIRFRSQSIFVTSSRKSAVHYGFPYIVYPIGKHDYLWSPDITDMAVEFSPKRIEIEHKTRGAILFPVTDAMRLLNINSDFSPGPIHGIDKETRRDVFIFPKDVPEFMKEYGKDVKDGLLKLVDELYYFNKGLEHAHKRQGEEVMLHADQVLLVTDRIYPDFMRYVMETR